MGVWLIHELTSIDSLTATSRPVSLQAPSSQTTFSTQTTSAAPSSSSSSSPSSSSTVLSPSGILAPQNAGTTQTSSTVPASGLSTTTTVGMVAGACAVLLVLGAFAAFFYRRKAQKKMAAAYGKTEDEKSGGGTVYSEKVNSAPSTISSEKAPRISVRPVTAFMPNLGNPTPAATAAAAAATTTRQTTSTAITGLSAAPSETRKAPPPALSLVMDGSAPSSPFTSNSVTPAMASPISADVAGAAAFMNPVHRVQMEFKPSMGDELELRAGALVRLLHEYDDGWALCTRLDRSQQGVCPRTCLSQRPVKPRTPDSPSQARTGSTSNSRPQSPVIRPYSPITGPQNRNLPQPQRPQSPAMPRSPGVGYVKAQYRPAATQSPVQSRPSTPTQTAPQSPISNASPPLSLRVGPPLITISTAPELLPGLPSDSKPQSPVGGPSPTFAPIKPSPLSNEQTVVGAPNAETGKGREVETEHKVEGEQLVFHAM